MPKNESYTRSTVNWKKSVDSFGKSGPLSGSFWPQTLALLILQHNCWQKCDIVQRCKTLHFMYYMLRIRTNLQVSRVAAAGTTTTQTTTTLWSLRLSECDQTNAKYVSILVHFLGHCVPSRIWRFWRSRRLIESLWLDWHSSITLLQEVALWQQQALQIYFWISGDLCFDRITWLTITLVVLNIVANLL